MCNCENCIRGIHNYSDSRQWFLHLVLGKASEQTDQLSKDPVKFGSPASVRIKLACRCILGAIDGPIDVGTDHSGFGE